MYSRLVRRPAFFGSKIGLLVAGRVTSASATLLEGDWKVNFPLVRTALVGVVAINLMSSHELTSKYHKFLCASWTEIIA
ncbi:unnamed protein product, partial [Mesorhabditis belari]|uniref:Uncharacterized protein n=1 Tax=Mesorhabditis belari TaxID=2138241 RepID=A0AAF3EJK6_9BILA